MTFHWLRFIGILGDFVVTLAFAWGIGNLAKWMETKGVSPLWLIAAFFTVVAALVSVMP